MMFITEHQEDWQNCQSKTVKTLGAAALTIAVILSREGVKQSPAYDSSKLLASEYEAQLYKHYGQPGYWMS